MPRFRSPSPRHPRAALAALLGALALCSAPSASSALAGAPARPRAHAASSFLTGLGDEQAEMLTDPLFLQLHTRIARYIAPYDAAVRPDELRQASAWIKAAEADHLQILLSFYHSEHTPLKLPSVATYQSDVAQFVKLFPNIHTYQPWDEANRGTIAHQLVSPSAASAARYYRALKRVCGGCTVVGLDVLDQANIKPTLRYVSEFKRALVRLHTAMPSIWGLHNYSDVNRLESWRTRKLVRAFGGQVWLTETGGVVQFDPTFPNRHGSGLKRAVKALKYMFALAAANPRITRLYIYDWSGGTSRTRFDAGLTNAHHQPRAGYVVVCKALHAARCDVKTANS